MQTSTDVVIKIRNHLRERIGQLHSSEFTRLSTLLSTSIISQYVRRTLGFFSCLESGFNLGVVNYKNRRHDSLVANQSHCSERSFTMIGFVKNIREDKDLTLGVRYNRVFEHYVKLKTNVWPGLVYNVEHAVEYKAIIKIGVIEIPLPVALNSVFGIAASAVRYSRRAEINSSH